MMSTETMISRQSNFEALRIIGMIAITVLHMWGQTEVFYLTVSDGVPYFFCLFFGFGGRLACNCFVMIGAWFLCDTAFKAERVIKLWLQVLFYAVTISVACVLLQFPYASFVRLVQAFFPIMGRPGWFPAEYMLLLLLSPFLNRLLMCQQGEICRKLLIFMGAWIIVPATLFPIEYTKPVFSELIWFCFLYLLTAYLKKHPMKWMNQKKLCIGSAVILYSFNLAAYMLLDYLGLRSYGNYYMFHYEAAFPFVASLLLFMAFKNIDIGNQRWINFLGRNTFAVYLIHVMPCLNVTVWNGIFHVNKYADNVLYLVSVVVIIFAAAIVVESIRKALFDKFIYKRKVYKKVCRKVDGFYHLQEGY